MQVAIVYNSERKGSTYNCVRIIKQTMESLGDVTFNEVFLSKELPDFCMGCFNCFLKGENTCPHYINVQPIVETMIKSDAIILASPTYGLNVTSTMKNFIDHLCYMWMPHRPNKAMFSKIGFVISTTAGMGTYTTNKTMKRALNYMAVKKTYSYGTSVAAVSWKDVKESKKKKIEKQLVKKATLFYKATANREKSSNGIFIKILFKLVKSMQKGYEDDSYDKKYWRKMGWLDKEKPF